MLNLGKFQYLSLLMLLMLGGCRSRSHIVNLQTQWTGSDPKSIPLNIREKEFHKGNLLSNPSFELGRYYNVDTVRLSFNLPGWKKVGEDVVWTNTQNKSEFEPDEAFSGIHAVRIERSRADETDVQGEGIISDYVKVIPGNYRLSLDVKLSHVESNLARLGTGIYDAVNIQVFYYDRNKVLIRNDAFHPAYDNRINVGFKGQPFSNFNYISELGWSRLIGRSGNFPFDEGNIPDDARYVRIFAGLKGTGIMWVDMVDFHYSSENFTFLEKVSPMFDSTLEKAAFLLPRPQKTEFYKKLDLVNFDDNKKELKPLILIPSTADASYRKIISVFLSDLKSKKLYSRRDNPVVTRLTTKTIQSGRLIFSFGNTDLSNQFSEQLPVEDIANREQACYIQRLASLGNVIFIGSTDAQGLYHAINTLDQLIDVTDNIYHHYDIIDYPDFPTRGMIVPAGDVRNQYKLNRADRLFLIAAGLNEFIVEPEGDDVSAETMYNLSLDQFASFKALKRQQDFLRIGVSFMEQKLPAVNLVRSRGNEANREDYIQASTEEGQKTAGIIKKFADAGADLVIQSDLAIWNCLDLGAPGNSVKMLREKPFLHYMDVRDAFWRGIESEKENEKEKDKKTGDAGVQTYLYSLFPDNRIKNQLNPGEFCYYKSLQDFRSLYTSELWTGPVAYSTIIDDINLAQFSVNNPLPVRLFDNTLTMKREDVVPGNYLTHYPGRALTGVLFEPYDVEFTPAIRTGVNVEAILNVNSLDELTMVRLATAADYLWNTGEYDPWMSAWKVLVKRYGQETAEELVWFNDLYYNILYTCLKLEQTGYNPKLIKSGDDLVVQLDSHWNNLKEQLKENVTFLNDLSDLKNRVISRFFKAKKLPGEAG